MIKIVKLDDKTNTFYTSVKRNIEGQIIRFVKKGFKTETEAKLFEEKEIIRRLYEAKEKALKNKVTKQERTLKQAIDFYNKSQLHLQETTRDQQNYRIKKYIINNDSEFVEIKGNITEFKSPFKENTKISEINTEKMYLWKELIIGIDNWLLSPNIKRRIIKLFINILNHENDEHKNVLANLNSKNYQVSKLSRVNNVIKRKKVNLTSKEFEEAINKIDTDNFKGELSKLLLLTYWETSARRGEVLGLKFADIEENGLVTFQRSVRNSKKAGKIVESDMKTINSYRQIKISSKLTKLIENFYKKYNIKNKNMFIFSFDGGKNPIGTNTANRIVKKCVKIDMSIKDLRSSSINNFFHEIFRNQTEGSHKDFDNVMMLASRRLGHSDFETTRKYYVEAENEFLKNKNKEEDNDINFNYWSATQATELTSQKYKKSPFWYSSAF